MSLFNRMPNLSAVFQAPWRYRGRPPFMVVVVTTSGNARHVEASLTAAVQHFADCHLPPIVGRTAGVIDRNGMMLAAYMAEDEETVLWTGTEEGFGILGQCYDNEVDPAIWEMSARGDQW